jgi:hypothetical protein
LPSIDAFRDTLRPRSHDLYAISIGALIYVLSVSFTAAKADGPTPLQLQTILAAGSTQLGTSIDSQARQTAAVAQSLAVGAVQAAGGDSSSTVTRSAIGSVARTLASRGADLVNVMDFGAKGDTAYQLNQYATAVGSNVLTVGPPMFDSTWIGKTLILQGASSNAAALVTTVTAVTDAYHLVMAQFATAALALLDQNGKPVYHLLTYGTDDTGAINAALTFAKTEYLSNNLLRTYHSGVYFPGRDFLTTGSLDFTGIVSDGFAVTGAGARIHSAAVGMAAVDMIGSRFIRWEGPRITGEEYAPPAIGLQLGRNGPTSISADNHDFENLIVNGRFSVAAVLNENAETTTWNAPRISNDAPGAYAMVMDGVNHFRISSQFTTWTQPAEGNQSFDENVFINPIFFTNGAGSAPLWLAAVHRMRILGGYAANVDQTASQRVGTIIYIAANTSVDQLDLDLHTESTTTDTVEITAPTGVTSTVLEGLRLHDNAPFGSNSIFKIDPQSSLASVVMLNADIDIHQTTSSGQKLFDNPSAWTVSGSFYLPDNLTNLATNFSGRLCIGTTCDATGMTVSASGEASQTLGSVATLANNALPHTGGTISGPVVLGNALSLAIASKSANFTFDATMHTVGVDSTSGPVVATLPACAASTIGRAYSLAKVDQSTNTVTMAAAGTDTISGAATVALPSQWLVIPVQCNGAGLWIKGAM